jgi:hypothetical protein
MAVRYFTNLTTCSAIADAFDSASHDQLTRMLHGTWSGHTLLNLALRTLFTVAGGYCGAARMPSVHRSLPRSLTLPCVWWPI